MEKNYPSDEQIIEAVRKWGSRTTTSVVDSIIRQNGFRVPRGWTLRQLKRLEREGMVRRVASAYAVQYAWSAA